MNSLGLLRVTFAISILSHAGLLLQFPDFNPFDRQVKKQEIAVRYIKEKPRASSSTKGDFQKRMSGVEPFLKIDSKITASRVPPPFIGNGDNLSLSKPTTSSYKSKTLAASPSGVAKPSFVPNELAGIKKKVILPPIQMAKIDNPSYISYYQIVREKIRRSAYQSYNRNATGDVYISFVISNDGYVKDVRLAPDKTNAPDYLREIALKSVRNASPFPNFPKELDYPQLSFNIIISFEIE